MNRPFEMKGFLQRLHARVDALPARDLAEEERLRADLGARPQPPRPTDARAAKIHDIVAQAMQDTQKLFLQTLDSLADEKLARGYLELASQSLTHAEEMLEQMRLLAREPIDYGRG